MTQRQPESDLPPWWFALGLVLGAIVFGFGLAELIYRLTCFI